MGESRFYLIDATAFCYRAFYALPRLTTSFGQPTNAIYGFVAMLKKVIQEGQPEYMAVCFDVSRDTFRNQMFSDYKAQRPAMPDELSSQIPFIKKIVVALGITLYEKEGFEADDIIAALAKKAKEARIPTVIVSSDKDMLQLVDSYVRVLSPYKDSGILYDEQKVKERFGVEPKAIPEIIALMGDPTDNIPGVPGVGEKTAVDLLKKYGSLDGLLANLETLPNERLRKTILEHIETVRLNRKLACLDRTLDLEFELEKFKIIVPDYRQLYAIFSHLELKRFLKDIPLEEKEGDPDLCLSCKVVEDSQLPKHYLEAESIFICGDSLESLVFAVKGEVFRVKEIGQRMRTLLVDGQVKKIGHDLKKIRGFLAKAGIRLEGLYFDAMIAAYLLNPVKPSYQISDLAWEFLGELPGTSGPDEVKAMQYIQRIVPLQQARLQENNLFSLFQEVEMPLIEVLADMESDGIRIDCQLLKELSSEIESKLVRICQKIYEISGCHFNINSPKQLSEVLFVRLKLPVVKKTKTGPSTDEEVLRALSSQHELPALLLEYRQLTKLKNTYIDTLPNLVDKKTQRIHASFNQTGTETGRLSSSNPNLQNIPVKTDIGRLIRQAVIAYRDEDYILSCDYSQIELRVLAHLAQDEELIQAFRLDKDIHRVTAALIYGLPEKDITDSMREVAKRVNFGIIYGLTAYGLARDLNIPLEDAQQFIDAFFLRYPKVQDFIKEQIKKAQDNGFVTTMLGRRRPIPEIKNKNQSIRQFAQRQAVNTPIQGSASDLIKLAMVRIHRNIKNNKFNSRMILQVHDELVFNLASGEEEAFTLMVKKEMENALQLVVPLKVTVKKGKNWLDMQAVT